MLLSHFLWETALQLLHAAELKYVQTQQPLLFVRQQFCRWWNEKCGQETKPDKYGSSGHADMSSMSACDGHTARIQATAAVVSKTTCSKLTTHNHLCILADAESLSGLMNQVLWKDRHGHGNRWQCWLVLWRLFQSNFYCAGKHVTAGNLQDSDVLSLVLGIVSDLCSKKQCGLQSTSMVRTSLSLRDKCQLDSCRV